MVKKNKNKKKKSSRRKRPVQKSKTRVSDFKIVGIGASAGGLEALNQLLAEVPGATPMAFIVIQHLDPKHESMTADILAKTAFLRVSEAKNNEAVKPGHIYVLPSSHDLCFLNGRLKLIPRDVKPGQHMPIDSFFQALANELGSRSAGVILSGTGKDGSKGVVAIKNQGGITFAQDPASAKFKDMPENAIATGSVDFVRNPKLIAKELVSASKLKNPLEKLPALSKTDSLHRIFQLLQKETQTDFSQYKLPTILRRISRRLVELKIKDHRTYTHYLETHPSEIQTLFLDTLIHVTRFFRDPRAFEILKTKILQKYLKNHAPGFPFRVWVPGCSSGEEAYSIAICFFELIDKNKSHTPLQIFATDLSEEVIRKARTGFYPNSISKEISRERLNLFFDKVEGGYKVSKRLRDACVFSKHDCTAQPPFARVDMISCRNLLIYFGAELQKRVIPIFHYALKSGGIFWLGQSETIGEFSSLFSPADNSYKFFYKRTNSISPKVQFPMNRFVLGKLETDPMNSAITVSSLDLQREADRATLSEYGPPSVIINDSMEILQARGHTSPYLELPTGRATLNLFKMVRREIVTELRTLIRSASEKANIVKKEGFTLKEAKGIRTFSIKVVPIRIAQVKDRFFIIYFEESKIPSPRDTAKRGSAGKAKLTAKDRSLFELRQELFENQEYQQALAEEFETTQESLTASNEELQSANEELQSTNEELETAKEELQSSNEELTTVNDELQTRNGELLQSTADLNNLFTSTDIPIVIVGSDLKIRRFTPNTVRTLKLIPSDLGRFIGDIKPDIQIRDLARIATQVIETNNAFFEDTQDAAGKWHRLEVKPYRTAEGKIDGAVIALIDIDSLKKNADELKKAHDDSASVIEGCPIPLLVISADRRIHLTNQAFSEGFKVSQKDAEGKFIFELGNGAWNFQKLTDLINKTFNDGNQTQGFGLDHEFPVIGKRSVIIHAKRTQLSGSGTTAVLLAIEDFTQRRQAEQKLAESEERYKKLLESTNDGIMVINQNGVIEFANSQLEKVFRYPPGEIVGKNYSILIRQQDRKKHQAHQNKYMNSPVSRKMGQGLELIGICKDGTEVPIDVSLNPEIEGSNMTVTCLVRDVTNFKKLEQDRNRILEREQELRVEAEKNNRMKDEFLAVLSHELRTPLTSVLTWAQILRMGLADTEKTRQGIAVIESSAKAQSELIDDLLDVSRIQSGKLFLNSTEVGPTECLRAALDSVQIVAEKKSIHIEADIQPIEGKVLADASRLQQVFLNLLSNAIKFSPEQSKVKVSLKLVENLGVKSVQIQFTDHGRGIKSDFLPYIFKRFSQADSSTTRAVGGLGLGMSIVHSLVEMQGGTVVAESPGEGKGATFTVTFPLISENPHLEEKQTALGLTTSSANLNTPANLAGIRVLLVEDEKPGREALTVMLESFGARVRSVGSAQEGLIAFLEMKPDILVSDIGMPDEDGYSFIRKIRSLKVKEGSKTPALALSAYAGEDDIRRSLVAGFSKHIAKPVDAVLLSHAISEYARREKLSH